MGRRSLAVSPSLPSVAPAIRLSLIEEAKRDAGATLRNRLACAVAALEKGDVGVAKSLLAQAFMVGSHFQIPFEVPSGLKGIQ
jgi:hypothetical protein